MTIMLGLSHIIYTTDDIKRDRKILENNGYTIDFYEKELPNNSTKKSLLERFSKTHDICFMKKEHCSNIELIKYSQCNKMQTCLNVIRHNKQYDYVQDINQNTSFDFGRESNSDNSFELCISVNKGMLDDAISFYEGSLGYVIIESDNNYVMLQYVSPINSWSSKLVLKEVENSSNRYFLDSIGFSCISFFTFSLDETYILIKGSNYVQHITEIFHITVNSQLLKIFLLKTLNGEMIEFIEINANMC